MGEVPRPGGGTVLGSMLWTEAMERLQIGETAYHVNIRCVWRIEGSKIPLRGLSRRREDLTLAIVMKEWRCRNELSEKVGVEEEDLGGTR